ncbi:T9SS type A sorting domain-containing protein [Fodinibius sp. AD559]|uniref:T9SS type A sorting domain-containing protein n=1 Tax=Fodinibius sp. AD559 TaxID=3424179 RepID=UPI004046A0BC
MTRNYLKYLFFSSILVFGLFALFLFLPQDSPHNQKVKQIEKPNSNQVERLEKKAARGQYYFRMLRNPATNKIPDNARQREIQKAKQIPPRQNIDVQFPHKQKGLLDFHNFTWGQAGPFDIGGRTRAMAVDINDPSTIIAGGVSGGIWKSTDGGSSWNLKTSDFTNLSVTSLAQDPTNPDTWYYVTGEFLGNSASDRGFTASYYGTGVYRSTDNGETWSIIPSTQDENASFDKPFDFMSRVVISPVTGSVFIASHGFGVLKLNESTQEFELVLGGAGEHLYTDIVTNSNGDLLAVISETDAGESNQTNNPGIYLSTDDGASWTNVSPATFPSTHRRSVAAFAPSAPDTAYVLTLKGQGDETNQGVSFHMIDIDLGGETLQKSDDRSEHLPNFGDPVGDMELQGGYNMMVAVKPDDPDFVVVGGINLFRSRDGFATSPTGGYEEEDKDEYWIGGYAKDNNASQYPNHHPDQHEFFFDQNDPDRMWSAHDGGISVTDNLTATSVSWQDMNEGYVTTQFYSAAISSEIGDNRVMGGTQDNGTPFFRFDSETSQSTTSSDISFGDGGYAYFTSSYLFVSRQNGSIIRYQKSDGGDPTNTFAYVDPIDVEEQLFVHPYVVDPNDEGIMYYPGASTEGGTWNIWRNTQADEITNLNSNGASEGWEELDNLNVPSGYEISALTVSRSPANILFYAGSSQNQQPVLYKLTNSHEATFGAEEISIPDAANGAYIHDIEVSPTNADEITVIISNYEVESIYHTRDGGETWQGVEGNLGDSGDLGPSVRSSATIPGDQGNIYFVGTSTGIYSTTNLDGSNTNWEQEATNEIGYAVVEQVNARYNDGTIVAGTHGLGMYRGSFDGSVSLPSIAVDPNEGRAGEKVTITASNFEFNPNPEDNEVTFGTVMANVLEATTNELVVEVPRGAAPRDSESNTIQIKATSGNVNASQTFTLLPPNNFAIKSNYPNPFRTSTTLPFDVPSDSRVTIAIYNMNGQKVSEPVYQKQYNAGSYNQNINISKFASGIYIYRVVAKTTGGETYMESDKMTLIK